MGVWPVPIFWFGGSLSCLVLSSFWQDSPNSENTPFKKGYMHLIHESMEVISSKGQNLADSWAVEEQRWRPSQDGLGTLPDEHGCSAQDPAGKDAH